MRDKSDSRLDKRTDSGVNAKARTPMRSDQGPRPVLVL